MRNGIIAGGNLIVDYIKIIDYFPNKNMMCNIVKEVMVAVGGGPHNVMVTLAKLNVDFPLTILGLVGNDSGADLVINDFQINNINTKYIKKISHRNTSFTDVFTELTTGNRTFFHYAGANSVLDFKDFVNAAEESNAKIFLIANLLHLDKLDEDDMEYGMISARVFKFLIDKGFKIATDLVSVKSDRFSLVFKYCLKYIHYLIINEIEAQSMSGFTIREDNNINKENLTKTAELLIKNGVIELVVIHFPEGGFAMDNNLNSHWCDSFKVENNLIKSAVGCGDAFNAGMLYGLHQNLPVKECLEIANACARFCLFDYTTTGGATSYENIRNFITGYNK